MAIKLVDELKAMGNFPIAHAKGINLVKTDGTEDNLQNLYDNGELGGGDDSVTLTQQEYEALSEEQKLDGLYYTYDTKRIYKNGIQYGTSEPIPLTMEEYKALKAAGAIDEQQEYLVEADAEGNLLDAEDLKKSSLVRGDNIVGALGDKNFSTAPIGTVLSFAGQTAPYGYLLADGTSYKVADYPDLYAVIGNTYGGDSTNFNVPNLVDKFIQGSTTSGTEKEAGLPNITGGWMPSVPVGYENYVTGAVVAEVKSSGLVSLAGSQVAIGAGFKIDASKSSAVYGKSTTVQPPALTMVYIIKAFHTNEGVDSGVSDDVINYINNSTKVDVVLYDEFDIKVDNIQNRLYLLGNILYGSLYLRFDEEHNPMVVQEFGGWIDIGDVPQITNAPQLYTCISYADTQVGDDYAQGDVRILEGKLQVRIKKQPTVSRNNWYVFYNAVCMKVELA